MAAFFQKFLKTAPALGVSKYKVISRNVFIDNPFALKSEIESKGDRHNFFSDYLCIFDLSLNPKTPNATCMWFFSLIWFEFFFFAFYCCFLDLRLSSFNSKLNFR